VLVVALYLLLQLQAEVAELKQRLLEAGARPDVVDAAVQVGYGGRRVDAAATILKHSAR
jgi:hypothetical protein